MTPKQAAAEIEKRVARLQKAIASDLPRRVGKIAVDYYRDSFDQQGFLNNGRHPWKPANRIGTVKGAQGKYGTLLSRRKELYNSIHFVPGNAKVNVISNKPYSRIHNEGGITHPKVTPKMRKWAWANYYEQVGKVTTNKKTGRSYQSWSSDKSAKINFYKAIALTKKTQLNVTIPKRQFMGKAPELNSMIKADVLGYVEKIMKSKTA